MKNEIILYQPNSSTRIDVNVDEETVWLTQAKISKLFDVAPQNITYHLKKIYQSKELEESSTCKEILQVQIEGGREIARSVKIYNLDAIISVGYRINSSRATQFRIWATAVLKKYLLKGYAIEQRIENLENKIQKHEHQINFFIKSSLPPREGVFFEGQIFDAFDCVRKIIKTAKSSIIVIDNYIDDSVLTIFCDKKTNVAVKIYTTKIPKLLELAEAKFNEQYGGLKIFPLKISHDRFIIIDNEKIYLFGASLKDLGKKWFGFTEMDPKNIPQILSKLPS